MTLRDSVTAIVVNYKTRELIETCVRSFVKYYPGVLLLLIDNHSQDASAKFCKQFASDHNAVRFFSMPKNVGHGPAMDFGVRLVKTRYFFTLDSDSEMLKRSLLEHMLKRFNKNDNLYAVGWLRYVNEDGVAARGNFNKHKFLPYIHPHAAMFDRWKYVKLPPFAYHGAPCYFNMVGARKAGYAVVDFANLKQYVKHEIAGTRRMWGGAWDIRDKPPTKEWKRKDTYPI